MKFIFLKRVLVILCLTYASFTTALTFNNPYMGNVIAGNSDQSKLQEAALRQVLVKVSGSRSITSKPEVKKLLKNPTSLLAQSGFQIYRGTEYYYALFDQRKINHLLKSIQQPVWGTVRPTTLVWLAVQGNAGRHVMSDSSVLQGSDWALTNQPRERGIELKFPIMDLEDRSISTSSISGKFYNDIAKASKRYGEKLFVVAYMKQETSQKWKLSWTLVSVDSQSKQHKELVSKTVRGSRASVEIQMTNKIADYYASQYAVSENDGKLFSQQVFVKGISDYDKFSRLTASVKKLSSVSSFEITTISENEVVLNVKLKGGFASFENAMSLNRHLHKMAAPKVEKEVMEDTTIKVDENIDLENSKDSSKSESKVDPVAPPLYFKWR
ncbi:MAG: DUF2066 domain-containing protein [Psychromonas sp.]|nr:DUF2066 domain-containing protein [Psychromonas sp.]